MYWLGAEHHCRYYSRVKALAPAELLGKQLAQKLIAPTLFAVLVYAALLFYGDYRAIGEALRALSARAALVGLALSLANFLIRGFRWHYYLRLKELALPFRHTMVIFIAGLGMSITPGKVGEVLKSLLLKEHFDVPIAISAPIVVAERVMDAGALITLGCVGLAYLQSPWLALAALVAGVGTFFLFGKSRWLVLRLVTLLTRIRRIAPFREKLLAAHASLFELWTVKAFSLSMLMSLVAWGMQAAIVIVFAEELGALVTPAEASVAYSAPLLAGTLAFLPGGLGLTEASMAGTLRALSGVAPSAAATITILTRGATFWFATVIGLTALFAYRRDRASRASSSSSRA